MGGILLIIFIINVIVSSNVTTKSYRIGRPITSEFIFTDTIKQPLTDIRRTNYKIITKPTYTYDEDGTLEVEYEKYDRSYYGGG